MTSAAIALGAAVVITTLTCAPAASASGTTSVGVVPASWTPWLRSTTPSQNVRELVPCGDLMYAVGTISDIGQGGYPYVRSNAFSFSATNGTLTSWAPQVNGVVNSVALSPDCSIAYLGGHFSQVNGILASNIVAVNTSIGALQPGFAHTANGEIDTLQYTHGVVLVGGTFTTINGVSRTRLASLDPSTGAVTNYANLAITGSYPKTTTRIYNSQLSHSGTKLLVEGVFTSIGARARQQMAVLNLGSSSVTVNGWRVPGFDNACGYPWPFYAQAGGWSPDDRTIYTATTGHRPVSTSLPGGYCDAVVAFPAKPGAVSARWLNYTGCDSMYAVVADTQNVYITGHERWADNPDGCDQAGPGSVARPGLGDISPSTHLATSWNPTRALGHGGDDMVLTSAGLWVASDNFKTGDEQQCGHQPDHGGICFLPYS